MVLGFKEYFDKKKTKPTYFREKILAGAGIIPQDVSRMPKNSEGISQGILYLIEHPKIHTMREGHRWKAGDIMHMAYGHRTKNYQQFNKGIPELQRVKSVQKIKITWLWNNPEFETHISWPRQIVDGVEYVPVVHIDKRLCSFEDVQQLSENDGFYSMWQFFAWFNRDFSGQLIHFTEKKY